MPTETPTRQARLDDPRYATPAADPETQRALRCAMLGLGPNATDGDLRIAAYRARRLARKTNGGMQ
jgi:hypothetical protein